jgi:hypothetical protein
MPHDPPTDRRARADLRVRPPSFAFGARFAVEDDESGA